MNKNVLLLCDDNSSLSIIAQAILNKYLVDIQAQSAGVRKSAQINPAVKAALQQDGSWSEDFHSKIVNDVMEVEYDLVIALSEKAGKSSSLFANNATVIQIEYDEPNYDSSLDLQKFIKTIKMELIPITRNQLS